jgi:hypothetical protein
MKLLSKKKGTVTSSKSDLRNHQAIVDSEPRLYDCLMVTSTQITLNTEPHGRGSIPARATLTEKQTRRVPPGLTRSPWPGVVDAVLLLS